MTLNLWTGSDSGVGSPQDYPTFTQGQITSYIKLVEKMRTDFPGSKWVVHPWKIHDALYDRELRPHISEWIKEIKDLPERDALTPDMVFQEKDGDEFAEDLQIFNSGVKITRDRVGSSHPVFRPGRPNGDREDTNRLYAAKAGIHGSWYNWYNRYSDDPNFQTIRSVYPRHKLIRCIPNWDNLNLAPLDQRSWDGVVYQSTYSLISRHLLYSRKPKTNKIFVVFLNHNGFVQLKSNEIVERIDRIDELFRESDSAVDDFEIVNSQIRLRSSISIAIDPGKPADGGTNIKGNGYIITLGATAP